jgi:uncharacterized membrane protein
MTELVYGDRTQATATVKYIALLVCFLASFTCFIHSTRFTFCFHRYHGSDGLDSDQLQGLLLNVRYYVQASFLITTLDSDVPASYVQHAIIRGGNFWSMGLRALYLATTLLMWIFGPIPMFTCSVLMVIVLHMLDSNSLPLHQHQFAVRKRGDQRALTPTPVARQPASSQSPIISNPIMSPVTFFY